MGSFNGHLPYSDESTERVGNSEHLDAGLVGAKRVVLFDDAGNAIGGLNLPAWNYMTLTQAATTDTYVFKNGGSGGTTVATIVITFTDSGKGTISTVEKT